MTQLGRISFGPLFHQTLGFENFIRDVEKLLDNDIKTHTNNSFPPHNIVKLDDSHYVVELAVAGFSKDDIEITVDNGTLSIKGNQTNKDETVNYLHRGIGMRSFTKNITIAETIEVRGAEFKDGILRVGLENIIPEHKKPRKIAIGESLSNFAPQLLQEEKVK